MTSYRNHYSEGNLQDEVRRGTIMFAVMFGLLIVGYIVSVRSEPRTIAGTIESEWQGPAIQEEIKR
jgi:hypothetical protein